jgi:hypothetical protein
VFWREEACWSGCLKVCVCAHYDCACTCEVSNLCLEGAVYWRYVACLSSALSQAFRGVTTRPGRYLNWTFQISVQMVMRVTLSCLPTAPLRQPFPLGGCSSWGRLAQPSVTRSPHASSTRSCCCGRQQLRALAQVCCLSVLKQLLCWIPKSTPKGAV